VWHITCVKLFTFLVFAGRQLGVTASKSLGFYHCVTTTAPCKIGDCYSCFNILTTKLLSEWKIKN